ncbi:LANO_0H15478g1_1 [Lachancea nothofagi CBS 11611]|uniref:LANO_0H15478g1_1 n=1 Tax=Lachancea nothofagi CBS 11611 TaxID=1266666 RepID=A0A1G4KMN1_9SACH|nr:LANO_0H15478g1_1 [Lachancea nothofagi CBS 11611]
MSNPGILHNYAPKKVAFEFTPTSLKKAVIFIGGLEDGLLTLPYVHNVVQELAPLGWSIIQIQMTSSYKGWGLSSLDKDAEEINSLVRYLRSSAGGSRDKIILFGHSTGSQDTMHYLLRYGETIDGGIMQGCVSDREGFSQGVDEAQWQRLNDRAKMLVGKGQKNDILPSEYSNVMMGTPITAYRWCSLTLPGGDDDYFSSDLSETTLESTFGKIKKPFLIAYSEFDQMVPHFVDKPKTIHKWATCSNPRWLSKHSGLIKGANHRVEQEDARSYLCTMVKNFMEEFGL